MLRTRRSPWIILLGLATLAAALFASLWQLYAAVAGLPVAVAMVIESVRTVGRPLLWFSLVIATYSVWGGLAYYGLHVL